MRGMAAAAEIKPDDIVVSVPRQSAITLPPKSKCPCPDFVSPQYWESSPWFVKLAVRLLNEKRLGSQSSMQKYIQQLPKRVDVPVLWKQELVQQLQYPQLIHKVTQQQQEWEGLYASFQAGLATGAPAVSQKDFFWALSLVRSRTFSGPYVPSTLSDRLRLGGVVAALVAVNTALGGDLNRSAGAAIAVFLFNIMYEVILSQKLKQYAMCPVIDFINHSSRETAEVSYDFFRDAFSVTAGMGYNKGDQVFVSYGAQANDSLMQYYGFAEANNPYDVYVTSNLLKWVEQLHVPSQERLDALNKAGLLTQLQEVVISRQGFPAETLQGVRYLLASHAEAARGPGAFVGAGDADVEQKLGLVLVHACQQELGSLGSSIAEDQQQLAGLKGSSEAVESLGNAMRFRIEKKRILVACVEQLCGEGDMQGAAAAAGEQQPLTMSSQ